MVFVVGHFSADWPEVDMDVEEIHIYGHLHALPFHVFRLIDLLDHAYLSVSNRSHDIFSVN